MTKLIVTFDNFANAPKNQFLNRETIAVCSEIQTVHISTSCGQNVEFVYVKSGGTESNH